MDSTAAAAAAAAAELGGVAGAWKTMPESVASGITRWPKPSMASGKEMKEPSLPSFMTILGPAHTRASNDGASLVMFRKARCWTVQAVKLCHMLVLSKTAGVGTRLPPPLLLLSAMA